MTKPSGMPDSVRVALKARVDGIGRKRVAAGSRWTYGALSAILDGIFQCCTDERVREIVAICDQIEKPV